MFVCLSVQLLTFDNPKTYAVHLHGRECVTVCARLSLSLSGLNLMAADTRQGRGENSPEPKANVFEEEKL